MNDNEQLLERAIHGDKSAEDRLIADNMGLVRAIANRFAGRGCDMDDLMQIGAMGLLKAIRRFDPAYEVQLSTYAVPMIMGEIRRFLRDDCMVKVSRTLKETAQRAKKCEERLRTRLSREPTIGEIAAECGLSPDEVAEAYDASRPHESIYAPAYSDGSETVGDRLTDGGCEEYVVNKVLAAQILGMLGERERLILHERYFNGRTQTQIAAMLGVSQVQVSRLEKKALLKIREEYGENG